ncbi:MAG: putative ABC transporter permease [Eggerthellaceae bacterium]
MLLSLATLLVIFILITIVWRLIERFWSWLGRGRLIHRITLDEHVDPELQHAVNELDRWRAEKALYQRGGWRHSRPPRLTRAQRADVARAERYERERFLDNLHLGWYQFVLIFFIGSILGLVIEEIWMFITAGLTQSRVGLVWGPFSPLYGTGAVILTIVGFYLRRAHATWWQIFLLSVIIGGLLEQITGYSMETLFHATSWSYLHLPDHITQWVAWRFLVFWGILGLVWTKAIMPDLLYRIGEQNTVRQWVFITLLSAYLIADIFMTMACFTRETERARGIPPENGFEQWVDEHYTDEFIANRFQNLVIDHETS